MLIGGDEAIVRPNVAGEDGRMRFPKYALDGEGSVSSEHFQCAEMLRFQMRWREGVDVNFWWAGGGKWNLACFG